MIAAAPDRQQRERLIQNCMALPNSAWDDIINRTAQDVNTLQVCMAMAPGAGCWVLGQARGKAGAGMGAKGREGKGREGKGREGKGREGKGREGKGREGSGGS
jgi:hypothetical protein